MIKVLMDECLPKKLKYRIAELDSIFFVKTTPEVYKLVFRMGN
jgi:hypothetical protein